MKWKLYKSQGYWILSAGDWGLCQFNSWAEAWKSIDTYTFGKRATV